MKGGERVWCMVAMNGMVSFKYLGLYCNGGDSEREGRNIWCTL